MFNKMPKKDYEQKLKVVLDYYYENGIKTFDSRVIPSLKRTDWFFLSAKGFVTLQPFVNQDPNFKVTLENKGITYFSDQSEKLKWYFFTVFISMTTSVLTTIILSALNH